MFRYLKMIGKYAKITYGIFVENCEILQYIYEGITKMLDKVMVPMGEKKKYAN